MKKFYHKNKTFNASHLFSVKNRCKHCGQNKFEYYLDNINGNWSANLRWKRDSYHTYHSVMSWLQDTNTDYMRHVLRGFKKSYYYGHSLNFKDYNPRFFKNGKDIINSWVIMIVCSNCYEGVWAYPNERKMRTPEIANRKARIELPSKAAPVSSKFW